MKHFIPNLSLSLIGLLLLGYVLAGRGFAHVGVPPVYIGEIVLAASCLLFLLAPSFRLLTQSRIAWLILLFDVWCFSQSVPYFDEFGLDVARDAVIYGYSLFAFIIAGYLIQRRSFASLIVLFDRAITLSVVLLPVILVTLMPKEIDLSNEEVPLVLLKSGDVAVHLAGALAFRLLGLRAVTTGPKHPLQWLGDWLFWPAWLMSFVWAVSSARAALLALACGFLVIVLFGFGRRIALGFAAVVAVVVITLATFDVRIEQDRREISAAQIFANAVSLFSSQEAGQTASVDVVQLESTAEWRLLWWEEIIDYTIFGEYFWTGRGFGVNVANTDGFQVGQDDELRSPHNGHLTVLARAGVPGFVLWSAIQIAFAVSLARMALVMKTRGAVTWQRINLWILSYWTAAVVNAAFDVYLEGPQGGIWYWAIMGTGMAVLAVEARMVKESRTVPALPSALRAKAP